MKKEEIIQYGLKLKCTYLDRPFSKDPETIALKHQDSKKWFVLIMPVKNGT